MSVENRRRMLSMNKNKVILKKGREYSLLKGHPWVFADAVEDDASARVGEIVEVQSASGEFLAQGFYNPKSSIALRVLTRSQQVSINDAWVADKLRAAIARRQRWARSDHEIQRLVAFEGDGLPGLIVDRYGEYLIFQILSAGMENFRSLIIEELSQLQPKGIIERSDEKVREKEGLPLRKELVLGQLPPEQWSVKEHGLKYNIDLWQGHKTGFYIDQSDNRRLISEVGTQGRILNCFCYTGGFSMSALKAGAEEVVSVDASMPALESLEKNFALNGFSSEKNSIICGDVFEVLKEYQKRGETFDGIILDPPKFASRKQHLKKALKGYRELNALGMSLLKPQGWLATFTCSGRVTRDEFQAAVEEAAIKQSQVYTVEQWLSQAPDHSVRLGFGESLYLKGLLLRRVE